MFYKTKCIVFKNCIAFYRTSVLPKYFIYTLINFLFVMLSVCFNRNPEAATMIRLVLQSLPPTCQLVNSLTCSSQQPTFNCPICPPSQPPRPRWYTPPILPFNQCTPVATNEREILVCQRIIILAF